MISRFRIILLLFSAITCGIGTTAENWKVIEHSKLPPVEDIDYPNCITHLAVRNVKSGEEFRVAGYGILKRKLTPFGRFVVGDEFFADFNATAPAGSEKEMRVDDLTRLELPLRWMDTFGRSIPVDGPPARDEKRFQQDLFIERVSIHRTLMAQIGPVTGGVTNEFFFYGDRRFYGKDFWKTSEVEAGGLYNVLIQFHQILKARGIRLIVVPTPSTMTIFPDHATNLYYRPELHGPINTEIQLLTGALRLNHGLEVLDITTPLINERYIDFEGEQYPIYRPNDTHWSSYAARLVAKICAQQIGELPSETPFRQTAKVETLKSDIEGILASKHPNRDQKVSPHRSPVFAVEPTSKEAAAMLDKTSDFPEARIHLIGDSFVDALSEWDADLHAHLVRLLGEPVRRLERYGGCSLILQDWLDGFGKSETLPETVIFIFGERFAAIDSQWQPLKITD